MARRPTSSFYYTALVDPDTLEAYRAAGSGGGSSAVTVADGADVAQGDKDDAAVTNPALSATIVAILKGLLTLVTTTNTDLVGLGALGYSFAHITTSTTTVVKASPGVIRAVVVNSLGTVASTCTVRDDATVIAVIDTLTSGNTGTYTFDVACATNITVVTTGTAPPDITVIYN